MLKSRPEISVIMPVYNAENYLKLSVESILNQSYTDFELIIINDGSTDRTLTILERYASKDNRIHLISRENKGLVATLNEGIEIARSPLIARMDADDIALIDRFKIQKEFMDSHPDVVCVGSRVRVIDSKGRFLTNNDIKLSHDEIVQSALQGVSPIIHPSAMIRIDALNMVNGYLPENFPAEDLALWIDLSEVGKLVNLDMPLLEYRIHDDSVSTSNHELQLVKTIDICMYACNKRDIKFDMKTTVGRAGETKKSKFEIILRHGWWAFSSQQWQTSVSYALGAIRLMPFRNGGWRLLFCCFFRRQ